ncbi:MAG: DUF899 family protein [Bryobacterales bacterium]|nr:DUF899 family protein [Bryobacterales bacterium]
MSEPGGPQVVDRSSFQAELDALRIREKAHTHEGDAIAAARRRLPMVEMDPSIALIGPNGPVTLPRRSRVVDNWSLTTSCGTPAILRRSSARGAPGLPRKSASCPISILVMPHLRCSARVPTRRAPGTVISWAGRCCPGTRRWARSKHSWLDAAWAGCTSFATCDRDRKSSRLTGRRRGGSKSWITVITCST